MSTTETFDGEVEDYEAALQSIAQTETMQPDAAPPVEFATEEGTRESR